MSTGARRERVVVTHVAGRIGDHNDRAMAASPRLAAALARRYDVEPVVIGSPRPALSVGWQVELDAARDELEALAAHYEVLWAGSAVPVTALSRCAGALATLPVVAANRPDALVVWFDAHADLNFPESTPSGYLGGLALSGPLGLWDSGLGAGLGTDNVVLAGCATSTRPRPISSRVRASPSSGLERASLSGSGGWWTAGPSTSTSTATCWSPVSCRPTTSSAEA